jgi:ABC-type dipeptide/oligopeptide/nickel transport system permease component
MRSVDFLAKRVTVALLTILVAATVNFALFRLAPGNAAQALAHVPGGGARLEHDLSVQFGLDKPEFDQYLLYLKGLVTGHLGVSFQNRQAVSTNLLRELENTVPMVLVGTILAIVIGTVIGIVAAVRLGTWADHVGVAVAMMLYSLPAQWVGLMLVVIFTGILPPSGLESYFLIDPSFWRHILDLAEHMVLPSLTFAITLLGMFVLVARSSMLQTLGEDYILTARAKGLARWAIVRRHALRNAMLPTVTLTALSLGYVVGGAILVEVVFSWPGIGLATYQAVAARDYPMLQGQFLVLAVAVVVCNLAADLLLFRLDPRVRT